MCPAVRVALLLVADVFDPDLPDVIAAGNLVLIVDHLHHDSAVLQSGVFLRFRVQVIQSVDYLPPYYLAHHAYAAALVAKILSAQPALYNAALLPDHAVDNDSCSDEAHAAARFAVDSVHQNTFFDMWAVVLAVVQNGDPTYPSHFYADSSPAPNDHPNAVQSHSASLQNKQVDGGSSAQERAI